MTKAAKYALLNVVQIMFDPANDALGTASFEFCEVRGIEDGTNGRIGSRVRAQYLTMDTVYSVQKRICQTCVTFITGLSDQLPS